ncbi:MAG: AMIN-like domain-containing (lipo)protein, partial [Candidatus Limnocylindria bacterium]
MSRRARSLIAAVMVLAACAPSASSPLPSTTAPSPSSAASPTVESSAAPTATPTDSETPPPGAVSFLCDRAFDEAGSIDIAHLADVRVGTHPGFDRIIFEFIEGGTPAYRLEPASPPFVEDPSGQPMTVNGSDFFLIALHGGTKVGADGNLIYTGQTEFEPDFPQLVHLVERGDFEAVS